MRYSKSGVGLRVSGPCPAMGTAPEKEQILALSCRREGRLLEPQTKPNGEKGIRGHKASTSGRGEDGAGIHQWCQDPPITTGLDRGCIERLVSYLERRRLDIKRAPRWQFLRLLPGARLGLKRKQVTEVHTGGTHKLGLLLTSGGTGCVCLALKATSRVSGIRLSTYFLGGIFLSQARGCHQPPRAPGHADCV